MNPYCGPEIASGKNRWFDAAFLFICLSREQTTIFFSLYTSPSTFNNQLAAPLKTLPPQPDFRRRTKNPEQISQSPLVADNQANPVPIVAIKPENTSITSPRMIQISDNKRKGTKAKISTQHHDQNCKKRAGEIINKNEK